VPIANVRELIAYAKAHPGKLRFGSSGIGAASHLSGELFKAQAQVDLQHVPYKGTGQALTDLLGGQIEVMFAPTQTVIPQLQSGRLKAIAVTGTEAARGAAVAADRRRLGPARLPGAGLVRPARAEGDAAGVVARLHDDVARCWRCPT
jgi:tripartite-type tricarboxylate transporter receptor subunit TctC